LIQRGETAVNKKLELISTQTPTCNSSGAMLAAGVTLGTRACRAY
jgi:hypothetical protein